MHELPAKYADRIQGVLSGFDRLVFRGSLRKIAYPFGMSGYLWANRVPLKNFGAHVNEIRGRVKEAALRCMQEAGREDRRRSGVRPDVRGAVLGLRHLSQPGNRDVGPGATIAQMSVRVTILAASDSGAAECADRDAVSVFGPDLHERQRVAGAADGRRRYRTAVRTYCASWGRNSRPPARSLAARPPR